MKSLVLKNTDHIRLKRAFAGYLAALGYAPSSVEALPRHAREFMCYLENTGKKIDEIAGADVTDYFHYLQRRPNRTQGGGLSPNYINKHRQALLLLSRYLYGRNGDGHRHTPDGRNADGFEVPPVPQADGTSAADLEESQPTVLTRQEIEALYEACEHEKTSPYDMVPPVLKRALTLRDRAMLAACYGCGLRRGEAAGLDTGDVQLRRGLLYVRASKTGYQRYVPIAAGAAADLSAYLREARPRLLSSTEKPHLDAFFISRRGGRLQGQSLLERVKELAKRAGLIGDDASPNDGTSSYNDRSIGVHTLRHSIATHLLEAGMPLEEIAGFLGHRSLEATQIYTHIADGTSAPDSASRPCRRATGANPLADPNDL